MDYTVAELRKKAELYRYQSEQAENGIEKEYLARIAEHWLELARADEDPDDQIN